MTVLVEHIDIIKHELEKINDSLNELTEANFESKMKLVESSIKRLDIKRDDLKKTYPEEELKKYNQEIDLLVKEIVNKFDNAIDNNKNEQQKLGKELRNILNKKKLANYR